MRARPINLPSATGQLYSGQGCITYWSVRDTTASTGSVFQLYDGTTTQGSLLVDVSTSAKQSTSEYIQRGHACFESGLYYNLASGTIEGGVSIWCAFSQGEWEAFMASLYSGQAINA